MNNDCDICRYCNALMKGGQGDYHRNYCRDYDYPEYLKLTNEYPAKKKEDSPPKLIYENVCKEFAFNKLVGEFPLSFKVKDWNAEVPHQGFFLGSIEGCGWMKENRPYVQCFSTFSNYTCSAYYPKMQELLFNKCYAFVPFKDLARRKWDIYSWLGEEALVFVRPDSGEKDFPAELVDLKDIDQLVENYDYDGLAVISTPKKFMGEWRFVVSREGICTYSLYKYQGIYTCVKAAPSGAIDLVNKVLEKDYWPDEIFCVDVVQDMGHNFWVMELTSFSSAGLYACDPVEIANLIKQKCKTL